MEIITLLFTVTAGALLGGVAIYIIYLFQQKGGATVAQSSIDDSKKELSNAKKEAQAIVKEAQLEARELLLKANNDL
ncbi:MAG: hypothetical protein ACN4E2_05645, partial [Nitrospinota bacterium]